MFGKAWVARRVLGASAAALVACGWAGAAQAQDAAKAPDAGVTQAGSVAPDAGAVAPPAQPANAGTPPANAGTPPVNAETPPANAGTPPANAGTPSANAGTPPVNAVTPPNTAGTPPNVAGTPPNAAGTPPNAAGTPPNVAGTPAPPATPAEGMSEQGLQVRLGLAGAAAVLPWAWLGLLALWRRKPQTQARYVRLANRSVAVATLVLALEGLLLALTLRVGAYEKLASWDALFLLVPLYAFAVWLLMLSRFDQGGQLVALRLLRSWGKWGGIALSALTVVNVGVWVFWGPLFQFVAPPSVALVGILAAVFLVKLWRTGDLAPAEQADPNAAPKAEPPKAEPPKADAKQAPKAEPPKAAPSPAPSAKAEPPKAAPSNIPDDFDDLPPLKPSANKPSSAQPTQDDARDELYRLLAAQEEDEPSPK